MFHSTLVSLIPDGSFISLTTHSRRYSKSQRFLLSKANVTAFLDGTVPELYDADLNNFLHGSYADAETIHLRISWLTGSEHLTGHKESFDLPVKLLVAAVNDQPAKYLVNNAVTQCPITLAASAQKMIHNLNQVERRALSKALRDNWYWRYPEDLTLYADWNDSFYFHTETICGGLCRHDDTVRGKDGSRGSASDTASTPDQSGSLSVKDNDARSCQTRRVLL